MNRVETIAAAVALALAAWAAYVMAWAALP